MATKVNEFLQKNPNYIGYANKTNRTVAPPTKKGSGRLGKNGLSAWISELAGSGGAIGGAAAGAAAGSVVPGIGNIIGGVAGGLIGGFAGGFGGRAVENQLRDNEYRLKDALGEGALSGAFGAAGGAASAVRGLGAIGKAGGAKFGTKAFTGAKALGGISDDAARATAGKAIVTGGKKAGQRIANGGVDDIGGFASGLLRQSSVAGKSSLPSYSEQKALTDLTAKFPQLRGSAFNKFKNVEPVIGSLHDDVTRQLADTGISINSNKVGERIARVAGDIVDPLEKKKFNILWNKTIQKEFGDAVPENLTLQQVNKLLGSVNKQASSAFRKITMGNPLTAADDAILLARDELGDFISENAPKAVREAVTKLNRQQSILIKGIPEFKRLSEQTVQLLGTNIPLLSRGLTRGAQSASDIAGRTAMKAGSLSDTLAGKTVQGAIPRGIGNQFMQPPAQDPTQEEQGIAVDGGGFLTPDALYGATAGQATPMYQDATGEQMPQQPAYTLQQALAEAYQIAPNASESELLSYAKALIAQNETQAETTGVGGPNITKVTGQQFVLASRGANAVDELEQLLSSDPSVLNKTATPGRKLPGVGGFISNIAGTGNFDAIGYNVANALLRLETGAQANPEEIKNLQAQMMPRAGDSPETVQIKLAQLRQAFSAFLNTANGQDTLAGQLENYQPTEEGLQQWQQ